MKDVTLKVPSQLIQYGNALNALAKLLSFEQPVSVFHWIFALRMNRMIHAVRKKIAGFKVPTAINNTQDYMVVMMHWEIFELAFGMYVTCLEYEGAFPRFVVKNLEKGLDEAQTRFYQMEDLIEPYDPKPGSDYFFQSVDQREIWQRRNKNYTYLNLQPDLPQMEDLQKALATLPD